MGCQGGCSSWEGSECHRLSPSHHVWTPPPPALGCSSGETEAHTENTARELPPLFWPGAQLAVTTGPSTLRHEETAPAEGRRVGGRHFLWSDGRARLRAWPGAAACQPRSSGEGGHEGGGAAAPSGSPRPPCSPPRRRLPRRVRGSLQLPPPGPTVQRGSHCHGQSGSQGPSETGKNHGCSWRTNPPPPLAAGGPRKPPNLPAPSRPTGPGNPAPGPCLRCVGRGPASNPGVGPEGDTLGRCRTSSGRIHSFLFIR